jgi:acyl-CoA reductase-like NAD-dependent aldehyde dehydrogenase
MTATVTPGTRLLENYVAGSWTPASSSADALDVTNPGTGETLVRVPLSSAENPDSAVRAARAALPAWRAVAVPDRARKLFALREGGSER